ncbi:hypothetical protein YPPY72_2919 [Yersinia pestis PY-72]|nr:hypothetical protein YPPY32_3153 [Yersinia pestis PY-32]EIS78181.1 hypothetical protein YPPY72_2919 [Yersinia pestis PY-72]EIS94377.1 hypothetical protein YPPY89_3093 [Yersinia pestis PY-89]EIT45075.1 hypothetical protein YPPY101_2805 [Yersinia pestis PY-101]EIT56749.1 hypothetical protein YPPY103_3025 [Yersinia pestis PY-103]
MFADVIRSSISELVKLLPFCDGLLSSLFRALSSSSGP